MDDHYPIWLSIVAICVFIIEAIVMIISRRAYRRIYRIVAALLCIQIIGFMVILIETQILPPRTKMIELIHCLGGENPEIKRQLREVIQRVAIEYDDIFLQSANAVLDDIYSQSARQWAFDVLCSAKKEAFDRFLVLAKRHPETFLPLALEMLEAKKAQTRRKAAMVVRLYGDVKLSRNENLKLMMAEGKWNELCKEGKYALRLVSFALSNTEDSAERARLVRAIRFRFRGAGTPLGPLLVNSLAAAEKDEVLEIAQALRVMNFQSKAAVPYLAKAFPEGCNIAPLLGICVLDPVFEMVRRNPGNQQILLNAIKTIGSAGPQASSYRWQLYDLIARLSEKHPSEVCEVLANIGPATLPFIVFKLEKGEDYVLALAYMGEEATSGDRDRDLYVNRLLLTTGDLNSKHPIRGRVFEKRNMLLARPYIDASVPLMKEICPFLSDDLQVECRRMTGITGDERKLQGDRIMEILRTTNDTIVQKAALLCLASLQTNNKEAVTWSKNYLETTWRLHSNDLATLYFRVAPVMSVVYFGKDAAQVVPAIIPYLSLKSAEPNTSNIIVQIKQVLTRALEGVAQYDSQASAALLAGSESNLYYAWLIPIAEGNKGAPEEAIRKQTGMYLAGLKAGSYDALYSARCLISLGEKAQGCLPLLQEVVRAAPQDQRIAAAIAYVGLGGKDQQVAKVLRDGLTVEKLKQLDRGGRLMGGLSPHIIFAVGAMGEQAKPFLPVIKDLCFDPDLNEDARLSALETLYVIDGGHKLSSRVFSEALACPLVLTDSLYVYPPTKILNILQRNGVRNARLKDQLREMERSAAHFEIRSAVRRILKGEPIVDDAWESTDDPPILNPRKRWYSDLPPSWR